MSNDTSKTFCTKIYEIHNTDMKPYVLHTWTTFSRYFRRSLSICTFVMSLYLEYASYINSEISLDVCQTDRNMTLGFSHVYLHIWVMNLYIWYKLGYLHNKLNLFKSDQNLITFMQLKYSRWFGYNKIS